MFQIEEVAGRLIELKSGQFIAVFSEVAPQLHILETTSAQCLMGPLTSTSQATTATNFYDERLRAPCSDSASSIDTAETEISFYGTLMAFLLTHFKCEIHRVQTICSWIHALLKFDIQGVLHNALSLRGPGPLSMWRECLVEEIKSRPCIVKQGSPPVSVQRRNEHFLRLFCSAGVTAAERASILSALPDGPWDSYTIIVYVGGARNVT